MYNKIREANKIDAVTKEQIEWLLDAHAILGEALMHLYTTSETGRLRDITHTALTETGILI